jgi:ureidoglycolate lyase
MMMPAPLSAEAFEPFGEVLQTPIDGRAYFERALGNARSGAWPSLSIARRPAAPKGPIVARRMERHEFSSQSFVPMEPARFLVLVAPHAPGGGPDTTKLRAFIAGPGQGVTYGANIWHHELTVLDRPASFAVFMWRDGTTRDEEFVPLAEPLAITIP